VAPDHLDLHSGAARGDGRGRQEQKGGWTAVGAGGAKAADKGLEARPPVAEAVGDLRQRQAVEEEGPQGFEAAMEGVVGLKEELAAKLVVHGAISSGLIIFRPSAAAAVYAAARLRGRGEARENPKKPGKNERRARESSQERARANVPTTD
jgi:hypothetical protein